MRRAWSTVQCWSKVGLSEGNFVKDFNDLEFLANQLRRQVQGSFLLVPGKRRLKKCLCPEQLCCYGHTLLSRDCIGTWQTTE